MEHQLELYADADSNSVTTSSSQLETVQPFTVEEDSPPSADESISELLPRDRRRSLQATPNAADVAGITAASADATRASPNSRSNSMKAWRSSNKQLSHNCDETSTSDERGTYSFSSPPSSNCASFSSSSDEAAPGRWADSSVSSDDIRHACADFATNHSTKSQNSFAGGGRRRECVRHVLEHTEPTNSSQAPAGTDEDSTPPQGTSENNMTDQNGVTSMDASGESSDSIEEGQNNSVFTNLGENSATDSFTEKSPAFRSSLTRVNKNELANLIEKVILDFCSSRTVETMRRMFAGVPNDSDSLLRDEKSASMPHPITGELVKEGVMIGNVDVFSPRMQREFILPVKDSLIATFLREPGVFRAICYRTRCQVEVTRRLLNRKLCIGGRWHKYMIIRIVGPTYKNIENCDILLQKAVPSYKLRKTYNTAASCCMYMREEVPDNTDLYFNFQRTGGNSHRFGALKLESPFRATQTRTISESPWKHGLFKVGKLSFSTTAANMCMKHVYPSMGYQGTSCLEPEFQGVSATNRVTSLHEQFHIDRLAAMALKRSLTIPVCR